MRAVKRPRLDVPQPLPFSFHASDASAVAVRVN
jgi:hypothetical protein